MNHHRRQMAIATYVIEHFTKVNDSFKRITQCFWIENVLFPQHCFLVAGHNFQPNIYRFFTDSSNNLTVVEVELSTLLTPCLVYDITEHNSIPIIFYPQ